MADAEPTATLTIKKYPNRRFYDTTRSRHVTLAEMHDLICQGHDVRITDSATGDDITNLVLTQIIIEHDPPKLAMFPSNILHQVIRTQQQMLGGVFEQFFRQMLEAQQVSQAQWTRFLQNTFGVTTGMPGAPFEWARSFFESMNPRSPRSASRAPTAAAAETRPSELDQLKMQMAAMMQRIEELSQSAGGPGK